MPRQSRVPVSEFKAAEKASTSNQIACVLALEKPNRTLFYQIHTSQLFVLVGLPGWA